MEIKEIQELIKFVAKSGVSEVEIESKGFKISIKTPPYKRGGNGQPEVQLVQAVAQPAVQAQPVVQAVAQPAAEAAPAKAEEPKDNGNYQEVKSPMIGTFYRSPSPEKPPFVGVGDEVKKGDVICIIEAMKLFNEIEAEVSGKIVKVLADDSSPVEYDQPLFLIEPH
ncbi:MAG: acetyl-CoA carboxylase biotin carboxyl carrier protein [Flavobacteriales bacterium]|nr:acetyl-CoA carboxylase biotin carboxyl carrier protein [Flavobacteriales bacterium]